MPTDGPRVPAQCVPPASREQAGRPSASVNTVFSRHWPTWPIPSRDPSPAMDGPRLGGAECVRPRVLVARAALDGGIMMKHDTLLLTATVLAALATPCLAQPIPCAIPAPAPCQVVMTELDNPRDLAFGPEGALYVAEAGRGGDGPCFPANFQIYCYGPSGAITRFRRGEQVRVVTGLPSMAAPGTGFRAEGPNGVS